MKNKRGITLVALVITIIILLILAGITITQLIENGLFEKVQLAKEKTEKAQAKENEILSNYDDKINEIVSNRNLTDVKWNLIETSKDGKSELNAINLPDNFNELYIEVSYKEKQFGSFSGCFYIPYELLEENYKYFETGSFYNTTQNNGSAYQIKVSKKSLYMNDCFRHGIRVTDDCVIKVLYR